MLKYVCTRQKELISFLLLARVFIKGGKIVRKEQ